MNVTASRSRPDKSPETDSRQLLVDISDFDAGRLVWSDGSVTTFLPTSKIGAQLTKNLRAVKAAPKVTLTLKAVSVRRQWGWHNGRWTVTGITADKPVKKG